jgi:C-terminal processing protease CtpA/Prc
MRPSEHRDALAAAMNTLRPAEALILDMRANSGGSPDTVALLLGYLIDEPGKPLFEIQHRNGRTDVFTTPSPLPPERNATRPMYVLTSARTFSAGEGLPFLLQELGRAIVVGEPTAGAANPGRAYPIDDVFEVTVPNGRVVTARRRSNWEGVGVIPDVPAAAAEALQTAHVRAIDDILVTVAPGTKREQLLRTRLELAKRR